MSIELIPPMVPFTDKDGRITRAWFLFLQKQFELIQVAHAMQSQQQEVPVLFNSEEVEETPMIPGVIPGPQGNPGSAGPPAVPVAMEWLSESETEAFSPVTFVGAATVTGAAAAFVANSGTAVNTASTFDGYTIGQVVKALRNNGQLI